MTYEDYFKSEEFMDILHEYEDCQLHDKPCMIDSDDYADIAQYYHDSGFDDKSRLTVEQGLSLYPNTLSLITIKIRHLLMDGASVEEVRALAEQVEDKDNGEYELLLAEIMLSEQQYDEADEYLEKCFQGIPDEEDREDFACDSAWLFHDFQENRLARKWLEKCQDKDEEDFLELHGMLLMEEDKFADSLKVFNKLLDRKPFSTKFWRMLSLAQINSNDISESVSSCDFALAINPNDCEAQYTKANALHMLGNYSEALEFYKRFSTQHGNEPNCEFFQGNCLDMMGQPEKALEHMEKAVCILTSDEYEPAEGDITLMEIQHEMAFLLSKMGRIDEAMAYIGKIDDDDIAHKAVFQIAINLFEADDFQHCYDLMLSLPLLHDKLEETERYAYLATSAFHLNNSEAFLHYYVKALDMSESDAQEIFDDIFPDFIPIKDAVEQARLCSGMDEINRSPSPF